MTITATFDVGTDIDTAVFNVNNRVQLALPRLPDEVRRNGVTVQKRSQDILLLVSLVSPDNSRDTLFLSNFATITLVDELKRVPGVADVSVFGARDYSMRIWLRPDRLAQLGLTVTDVAECTARAERAVRGRQDRRGTGSQGTGPRLHRHRARTPGRAGRVRRDRDPRRRRRRRAAPEGRGAHRARRAELRHASTRFDGKPSISMATFLQSGGNALDVAEAVRDAHEGTEERRFRPVSTSCTPFDPTRYVEASIKEVTMTIIEAGVLVILVVFLFLQTWRATLIPIIAVPVSLIGTFAGLWLAGFSINTLTLFAMVLAIGIVVDDAIVVLENVERLMRERKMAPLAASIEAMHEVSSAVIAIVLVLCAVFVPVAFLTGIAGAALSTVRRHRRHRRRHLGIHRADADTDAVRAAAARRRITTRSGSAGSTAPSMRPRRRFLWSVDQALAYRGRALLIFARRHRAASACSSGSLRAASCRPRIRAI